MAAGRRSGMALFARICHFEGLIGFHERLYLLRLRIRFAPERDTKFRRGFPKSNPLGFRTSWAKACDRAGIDGLTFHDLRGSAVVRLAIAGATVPQIAAVTGHSLKDVEAILDAHYLGRDIQLAEAAVLKLEARTKL